MLSSEVLNSAECSVLCWLATADVSGQPNVSPKEIFAVLDADHIVIANIASPKSLKNIQMNPQVCVSFIDIFAQKGFKVIGTAEIVRKQDIEFEVWAKALMDKAGARFPIQSVIVIRSNLVEPILAPSYRLYPNETTEESQVTSAMRTYGVKPAHADA